MLWDFCFNCQFNIASLRRECQILIIRASILDSFIDTRFYNISHKGYNIHKCCFSCSVSTYQYMKVT